MVITPQSIIRRQYMNVHEMNSTTSVSQTVLPNENTDYLGIYTVDISEINTILDAYTGTSEWTSEDY